MTIETPTPELAAAMKKAFSDVLRSGAQLLGVWRSNLSNERAKQLINFEAKGLKLGLMIGECVQVILIDARGGIMPLESIDLNASGASLQ